MDPELDELAVSEIRIGLKCSTSLDYLEVNNSCTIVNYMQIIHESCFYLKKVLLEFLSRHITINIQKDA